MEVFKTFVFDAAHKLPNVPPEHKCYHLHGHTYKLMLYIEGPLDGKLGWVQDFAEIKSAFDPYLQQLDHKYLNEIDGLENPTCENIAKWIWDKIKPSIPGLVKIVIQEGVSSGVIYTGD